MNSILSQNINFKNKDRLLLCSLALFFFISKGIAQEKYPDIIKAYLPEANLGMMQMFLDSYERCSGKYIAWLDGDEDNRRHWHNSCWSKRNNRRPNTERTRNAPRY